MPVTYFSADSDIEESSAKAGVDDYLAKPYNLEDLQEIIVKTAVG